MNLNPMKRINFWSSLLLLFVISFPALGQDAADQPQAPSNEKSLLWEISGKDLKKPSYLYGTIHMIDREHFFMTDETKAAFAECKRVAFEIDMAEMTNLFSQISLMMQVMMDDGIRLSDLLTAEEYEVVSSHFEDLGMPMFFLDRIKPLFLSALSETDMSSMDMSGESSDMVSYEFEFYDMAKAMKMETAGLETAEYQISLFDSIPYQVQAQMLLESIEAPVVDGEEIDQMDMLIQLYKDEDIEAMTSAFNEEDSEYAPFEELLLTNRNRNWIPIMEDMMAEKQTFFAVGAGHLGGELGVVNLLREAGYTLRPLHQKMP